MLVDFVAEGEHSVVPPALDPVGPRRVPLDPKPGEIPHHLFDGGGPADGDGAEVVSFKNGEYPSPVLLLGLAHLERSAALAPPDGGFAVFGARRLGDRNEGHDRG